MSKRRRSASTEPARANAPEAGSDIAISAPSPNEGTRRSDGGGPQTEVADAAARSRQFVESDDSPAMAPAPDSEHVTSPLTPLLPEPVARPAGLVVSLGGHYLALQSSEVTDEAAVWKAALLPAAPDPAAFEVLDATPETRDRLLAEARAGRRFPDLDGAESVRMEIALPGQENSQQRKAAMLRRLGQDVPRLDHPTPAGAAIPWPEFPCLVTPWVSGSSLAQTPAFSEPDGLEVCAQLADLLSAARLSAPDVGLTDALQPGNVYWDADARRVQLLDWPTCPASESEFRERTLLRFGELMTGLFAPAMDFRLHRSASAAPIELLGAGAPDDPGAQQWDRLSYGTRALIRRVLQRDFAEGDTGSLLRRLRGELHEQRDRWLDPDPLAQAQADAGAVRLNWLDIAAAQGKRASSDERKLLLRDAIHAAGESGHHAIALLDLRSALRRYPGDAYFRWATLAHTVAALNRLPRAYVRLRLGEALAAMREGSFALARALLESRGSQLPRHDSDRPERAGALMASLFNRIDILRLAIPAQRALEDEWRIEDAEAALDTVQRLQAQSAEWEAGVLTGEDPACAAAIQELRAAVADFHARRGDYDLAAEHAEALTRARRGKFDRLIRRARRLADLARELSSDDLALEALSRFDRAADEFPDLWLDESAQLEPERIAARALVLARWEAAARRALERAQFDSAGRALQAALRLCPEAGGAAAVLTVLQACQRARFSFERGRFGQTIEALDLALASDWPEIHTFLLAWRDAATIGLKMRRAEEQQLLWPESVAHAAEAIRLAAGAHRDAEAWESRAAFPEAAEWLRGPSSGCRSGAEQLWQRAVETIRRRIAESLDDRDAGAALYHHSSCRNLKRSVQTALVTVAEGDPPPDSPLGRLASDLDALWRKAVALYEYDRCRALIDARDYAAAAAAGREADEALSTDPAVPMARRRVAQTVARHLGPWWEQAYDEAFQRRSVVAALMNAFARFTDPNAAPGQLAELGDRFLGEAKPDAGARAMELLLEPSPTEEGRSGLAAHLSGLRPGDCRARLYHFGCVARLLNARRHDEAHELAGLAANLQQSSPNLAGQRAEAFAATKGELRAYWAGLYHRLYQGDPIAEIVQQGLRMHGLSPALIKLAAELFPLDDASAPECARPGKTEPRVLARRLADCVYAGNKAEDFASSLAEAPPRCYPALLDEWNALLAADTEDRLRQAKCYIYARQTRPGELRFDAWHALTYVFSRERMQLAREALTFAGRIAPDADWRHRVGQVQSIGWLVVALALAVIGGALAGVWRLVVR